MKKEMIERWHAVFIIMLFLILAFLDFKIGMLVFIPTYLIMRGIIAIKTKKIFLSFDIPYIRELFSRSIAQERGEYQITLKGEKAIKKGMMLTIYGIIIFTLEFLLIIYFLIKPV